MYLTTARLILRDLRPEDGPALHAVRGDPVVARYMDWGPETLQQTCDWVQATIPHNQACPRRSYNLSIVRRSDDYLIGWIGIGDPSRPTGYTRAYDFGYALARAYWNQGYMTEALGALLHVAFTQLGTEYVYGQCDQRNVGSARVMDKVGLHRVAAFRQQDAAAGTVTDHYRYAIEASAWHPATPQCEVREL